MSPSRSLQAAMESIDFQKSFVFFDELTMAVGELRRLPSSNRNAVEIAGITKIIFHHTGINLDGEYINGYFNASILPPFIDARSPLLTYVTEGLRVGNDNRPGLDHSLLFDEGTINLELGKVTGVFSKVKGQLHIGSPLFDVLTDREIAAIVLHEVGHQFSYFEYIMHTSTLAVNLNYCASQLAHATEKEHRIKIIINTAKSLKIDVEDVDALAESKSARVPLTIMMENYTRQLRSGTGSNFYDYRSWEALADQFATRQGAGRDLVVGLDKIMRAFMVYSSKGSVMNALRYIMDILQYIPLILTVTMNPVFGVVFLALYALMLSSPFPPEGTYDGPSGRLTRVKNELVGALKDQTLSADRQRELHADIDTVDGLIAAIGKESGFLDVVWRALTSYRRENYKQVQFQADLEKLANNELFLAASKLSTLAAQ